MCVGQCATGRDHNEDADHHFQVDACSQQHLGSGVILFVNLILSSVLLYMNQSMTGQLLL